MKIRGEKVDIQELEEAIQTALDYMEALEKKNKALKKENARLELVIKGLNDKPLSSDIKRFSEKPIFRRRGQ